MFKWSSQTIAAQMVLIVGVVLHLFEFGIGGLLIHFGFVIISIFYFIDQINAKLPAKKFYKVILFVIPILVLIITLQSFIYSIGGFFPIIVLLLMHTIIKGKFGT